MFTFRDSSTMMIVLLGVLLPSGTNAADDVSVKRNSIEDNHLGVQCVCKLEAEIPKGTHEPPSFWSIFLKTVCTAPPRKCTEAGKIFLVPIGIHGLTVGQLKCPTCPEALKEFRKPLPEGDDSRLRYYVASEKIDRQMQFVDDFPKLDTPRTSLFPISKRDTETSKMRKMTARPKDFKWPFRTSVKSAERGKLEQAVRNAAILLEQEHTVSRWESSRDKRIAEMEKIHDYVRESLEKAEVLIHGRDDGSKPKPKTVSGRRLTGQNLITRLLEDEKACQNGC